MNYRRSSTVTVVPSFVIVVMVSDDVVVCTVHGVSVCDTHGVSGVVGGVGVGGTSSGSFTGRRVHVILGGGGHCWGGLCKGGGGGV